MKPTAASLSIPASLTPPSAARGSTTPSRLAWQREMERAQSETWFQHAAPGHPPSGANATHARGAAAPPSDALAQRPAPPQPVLSWSAAPPTPPAPQLAGAIVTESLSTTAPPSRSEVGVGAPLPAMPGEPNVSAERDEPSLPRMDRSAPVGPRQPVLLRATGGGDPVRVHVQWDGDAARVWVGVDAAHALQLPEVAGMVVHWLSGQGIRVQEVVCNGKALRLPAPASRLSPHSARPDAGVVMHITTTRDV